MTELINAIQGSQAICRLGWTLLHTLWLAAAVAAVYAVVLGVLRRRSANARYLAGCVALVLMVALPAAVFFMIPTPPAPGGAIVVEVGGDSAMMAARPVVTPPIAPIEAPASPVAAVHRQPPPPAHEAGLAAQQPPLLERFSEAVSPVLPWIVLFWAGGVVALALWQLGGWIAAQRLKRLAIQPSDRPLAETVARLARAMRVSRPVKVLESMLVRVPTVIGWLRPVILLPAGVATGLTPQQLAAILAHELAHIRRYDYLVNLLQSLAETLLFYHPAVWLVSRRVRAERENCCDDIAVAAGAERFCYAESLLHLAQRSGGVRRRRRLPRAAAVAATGRPSQLRSRIRRLLTPADQTTRLARSWPISLACLVVALVTTSLLVTAGSEPATPNDTPAVRDASLPATQPAAAPQAEARELAERIFAEVRAGRDVNARRLAGMSVAWGMFESHRKAYDLSSIGLAAIYSDGKAAMVVSSPLAGRSGDAAVILIEFERKDDKWVGTDFMRCGGRVRTSPVQRFLRDHPLAAGEAGAKELARLWEALGSRDPMAASRALAPMVAIGDEVVGFVAGRLCLPAADTAHVRQLIARLDDAKYAVREDASDKLMRRGLAALPVLKQALKEAKLSAEARARINTIVQRWTSPSQRRRVEGALQVLAEIGTPRCRAVVGLLAKDGWFPWGKAAEGLQVRLWAERTTWRAGEAPKFRVDVRNGSKRSLWDINGRLRIYEIEVDGRWYQNNMRVRRRWEPIQPGRTRAVIPLEGPWRNWRDRRHKAPAFTLGKHVVRVAFNGTAGKPLRDENFKPLRIVSNPLEVEIVPAGTTLPATQPATITRVYDIRDLLFVVRDLIPPPTVEFVEDDTAEGAGPEDKDLPTPKEMIGTTRQERIDKTIDLIRESIAPGSWLAGKFGGVREVQGNLVITQTEENHKQILKLISQLREARRVLVAIEGRFISVAPEMDGRLRKWADTKRVSSDAKSKPAAQPAEIVLSDVDAQEFIRRAQADALIKTVAAPRVMLFNTHRAYFRTGVWRTVTLPLLDEAGQKKDAKLFDGAVLDVAATVSADRRNIVATLRPTVTRVGLGAGPVELSEANAETTVSIPDSATLLIRLTPTTSRLAGARKVTDPKTGKTRFQAVREPLKDARPDRLIYLLVKPRIIIQREYEELPVDVPPQPSTQPAADAAQIERLIKQLGSDKFADREAAQAALVKIGPPAMAALQAAGKDADKERAARASAAHKQIMAPIRRASRVAIFLVTDPPSVAEAEKVSLDKLKLADDPLICADDIESYEWDAHLLQLTSAGMSNLLSGRGGSLPFVLMVDGRRCYLGDLYSPISSYVGRIPVITPDGAPKNAIRIHMPIIGANDPRNDPRLRKALNELGKLASSARRVSSPVAWGEGVKGLQSGLRFGIQDRAYRQGESLSFVLLVRNIGKKEVTLVDFIPMTGWPPTVRAIDGKLLRVNVPLINMPVLCRKSVLKPGDILQVGTVYLQLDRGPEERGQGLHVYLAPGKYLVSQTYRFADAQKATWSGELTTGQLTLSVAAADKPSEVEVPATTRPSSTGSGQAQPAADAAQIERLIKQLGSDKYAEREAAQKELVDIGWAAVPALRQARQHKDPEVSSRAEAAAGKILAPIEVRRDEARQAAQQAAKGEDAVAARRAYLALLAVPETQLRDARAAIRLFEARKDWPALADAYEVAAETIWRVIHTPAEAFIRPTAEDPGRPGVLEQGGPCVEVQTGLDGQWSKGKGDAENWIPWIQRKQKELRMERVELLKKLGQLCLLHLDAPARGVAAYKAGGRGIPLHAEPLEKLIPQMWPEMKAKADKVLALDQAGAAQIRIEVLDGLAEAQVAAGDLRGAAETRTRAMLCTLISEGGDWNAHGAAGQAEAFWQVVRRLPSDEPIPPTLWLHVLDPDHPKLVFPSPQEGPHGYPLSSAGPNLVIRPGQRAQTLTVSAVRARGDGAIRCFTTSAGKVQTLGRVQWHKGNRTPEGRETATFDVPAGVGIVRLRITRYGGSDFKVHDLRVKAGFAPASASPDASTRPATTRPSSTSSTSSPQASSGQAGSPQAQPADESPGQFIESFLKLVREGNKEAAEMMTDDFDPLCWRFVVWRSAGNAANEMRDEFRRLRIGTLRSLSLKQRTFWSAAKLNWRQVAVSGDRAVAWLCSTSDRDKGSIPERQLLLRRQDERWKVAGLCALNLWGLEWQVDSAVTNPGSTWGELLCVRKSKDELAKAPLYVDLDTGRTYRPPQDGATYAWIKANGIDIGLGAYGPLPRGVRYHPPQGTFNFGARMPRGGVFSYWLVTPNNAPVLLADAPPARKEGGGQFSGLFLLQTREGTIGLLDAWSTGLKFIPMAKKARRDAPRQLGPYDTACLFLHAATHPREDKQLMNGLVGAGLKADQARKTIHNSQFHPQPMAIEWMTEKAGNALAITFPDLTTINGKRQVVAFAIWLSKRSGTWLVEDVRELHNQEIREAAEKFRAEHAPTLTPPATGQADKPATQPGAGPESE